MSTFSLPLFSILYTATTEVNGVMETIKPEGIKPPKPEDVDSFFGDIKLENDQKIELMVRFLYQNLESRV